MRFMFTGNGMEEAYSVIPSPKDLLQDHVIDPAVESAKEATIDMATGILLGLKHILVQSIDVVALFGCGMLIILGVAGWDKGYKWSSVLFVAYVFIKFLLGGL